jgi:hypothetical protein
MQKRRKISVSSYYDQSHYLHPHPYLPQQPEVNLEHGVGGTKVRPDPAAGAERRVAGAQHRRHLCIHGTHALTRSRSHRSCKRTDFTSAQPTWVMTYASASRRRGGATPNTPTHPQCAQPCHQPARDGRISRARGVAVVHTASAPAASSWTLCTLPGRFRPQYFLTRTGVT